MNAVSWYKVADGGGTISNAQYTVSATIGQHDASGPMTGGGYSLTGGFGSIYAVQTPGAPTNSPALTITPTPTNTVIISWPAPSSGFMLQESTDLGSSNWVPSTYVATVSGTQNQVTIPLVYDRRFYRLFHP